MLRRDYKRKRKDAASGKVLAVYTASKRRKYTRRSFVPGVDRTGGYYGRYSGRSGELKFLDTTLDDAVIAQSGVITTSINLIAQGVTESERVGRKCTIKSVYWSGALTLPELSAAANPGGADRVRLILYVDKQCNGATATQAGILETTAYDSFRNLSNSGRFQILVDKKFTINYLTLSAVNGSAMEHAQVVRQFDLYKRCNLPIEFDNTTGALTEIRSNNIGVLIMCANGLAGIGSRFRIRFSDY